MMDENDDIIPGMISVIVASYNHAEFLNKRMDSLINQTYNNYEIIVIDDCSSDNSVDILKQYSDNSKVILIINEKNSGWVNVSNKGVSLSKGEYIIFANCDDYSDSTQLEKLVAKFKKDPDLAMCFSASNMVDKNNKILSLDFNSRTSKFRKICNNDILILKEQMIRFLMHSCIIPNLSGLLIKKDYFVKTGGFSADFKVVSDWDIFFKLCVYGDTFWIREPLNYFRQHNETIRATTKDKRIYAEIFTVLYHQFLKWEFTFFERMKFIRFIDFIWISYMIKSPVSAFKNLKEHLKLNISFNKNAGIHLFIDFILFPFFKIAEKIMTF